MFCECGCGGLAPIARQGDTKRGYVKGQPCRFIVGHNHKATPKSYGYVVRYAPEHPKATSSGCVYEHVLIAERALGKYLPLGAEVHHVNEDHGNNSNANLVICQNRAYHKLLHVRARIVRAGGNPDVARLCSRCRVLLPLASFGPSSSNKGYGLQSACRECMKAYWADRRIDAAA